MLKSPWNPVDRIKSILVKSPEPHQAEGLHDFHDFAEAFDMDGLEATWIQLRIFMASVCGNASKVHGGT